MQRFASLAFRRGLETVATRANLENLPTICGFDVEQFVCFAAANCGVVGKF
jgi:hypothetical protein